MGRATAWPPDTNVASGGGPDLGICTAFSSNKDHGHQRRRQLQQGHGPRHGGGSAGPRWQHRLLVSACSSPPSWLPFLLSPQCTDRSTSSLPFLHHKPDDLSSTQPPTRAAGCRVSMQCVCACINIPFTLYCLLFSPLAFPLTPFLFSTSHIVPLLFSCHLFVYLFIHSSFIHSFGAPMSLHTVATEA